MKSFVWGLVIIIVLALAGFGIWGFLKAQEIKRQGQEIQRITSDTLNLETIRQNQAEISIEPWKNLSEKAATTLAELDKNESVSPTLKEKAAQYYGAKAKDKYVEAQYLQVLTDAQRKMDLKSQQPKSKGQIESILTAFNEMQNSINQRSLSLGPELESSSNKVQQEAATFKNSLTEMSGRMNNDSPPVQVSSGGLDKAIDDLKQEIANSLNTWVDLQNKIKEDTSNLSTANWVMPF